MGFLQFTYEELTAAGYRKYPTHPGLDEYSVALWQKRIRALTPTFGWGEGKTLYFVNLYEYPAFRGLPQSFVAKVHLWGHGEADFSFEIQVNRADEPNNSLTAIEGFFQGTFERLLCKPDPNATERT